MGRAGRAVWWVVEVGVPALGVFAGVILLSFAAVGVLTGALPEATRMSVFVAGLSCWAGGILWGALVNNGIPGLRDP